MADGMGAARPQQPAVASCSGWADLKRSWWILFTLVPFGWLAFLGFFYAGRKAAQKSWKLWALAYLVLSWGATVLASVEEVAEPWRQAGGMIMLFVAWPLPFVHALRIRRAYLERTGEHNSLVEAASMDEVSDDIWHPTPRSRWIAVAFAFFVVFGVVMTITGSGADRLWGLIMLLLFGAGGASLYIPKGDRRGADVTTSLISHHGRHISALVFAFDSRRHRIRLLSAAAFAVVGLMMVLFAGEIGQPGRTYRPQILLIAGFLMLIFFGWFALASLRRLGSVPRLALLSEGVLMDGGAMPTFVPWDAIETIGDIDAQQRDVGDQPPRP